MRGTVAWGAHQNPSVAQADGDVQPLQCPVRHLGPRKMGLAGKNSD
jgi:hypothetical protein